MSFSERYGYVPARTALQFEAMDAPLRASLWNAYAMAFVGANKNQWSTTGYLGSFYRALWEGFFKQPIDDIPSQTYSTEAEIKVWFSGAKWHQVYDFIEFVDSIAEGPRQERFRQGVSAAMDREKAAYRLIKGRIVPITDANELGAIDEALAGSTRSRLAGVNEHLRTALGFLSDRRTPDYRNSIKESISAVESMARVIVGEDRAELGKALRLIEQKGQLHGALKAGFSSLYGYTSDADGIRHALLESSAVGFDEAKFMLVACSAFINFLIAKAAPTGVDM